jgi:hypothetical protein
MINPSATKIRNAALAAAAAVMMACGQPQASIHAQPPSTEPEASEAGPGAEVTTADDRFYFSRDLSPSMAERVSEAVEICRRVRNAAPPPADRVSSRDLTGCSSTNSYRGIGEARDVEKARLCAFQRWDEAATGPGALGMDGPGILMSIYANGDGVERNLETAMFMACSIELAAPAETEGRLKDLQELASKVRDEPYDYCDYFTGGFAAMECVYRDLDEIRFARSQSDKSMSAGWTAKDKALLEELTTATSAFATLHADNESDWGAGGYWPRFWAGLAETEVHLAADQVMDLLREGTLLPATPSQAAEADRRLNEAYQAALNPVPDQVTADGVREAQRAWLTYRDAWLALAAARWPQASREGLETALIDDRVRQLGCLSGEISGEECGI